MAGTARRPPYTKVGQCVRWQGCDVGFFGGWWGFAVSVLSSAEDSGVGVLQCALRRETSNERRKETIAVPVMRM